MTKPYCGSCGSEELVCGNCHELQLAQMDKRLSAATQALTDMGCELREGVWMKPCRTGTYCYGGKTQNYSTNMPSMMDHAACNGTGWLPITRKSVVEGGGK